MQKKKYPYRIVLEARAEKKREAGRFAATCRKRLERAEEELTRRAHAVEDCRRQREAAQRALDEMSVGPAKARHVVEHLEYLAELKQKQGEAEASVIEQRAEVGRAVGTLEQAVSALAEAARDEQAAENHREDWHRERRREEERAEQKRLDELGSIFHGRRRHG